MYLPICSAKWLVNAISSIFLSYIRFVVTKTLLAILKKLLHIDEIFGRMMKLNTRRSLMTYLLCNLQIMKLLDYESMKSAKFLNIC